MHDHLPGSRIGTRVGHLGDDFGDRLLIVGQGPSNQLPRFGPDGQHGLGHGRGDNASGGGWVGRFDRVGGHLAAILLGRPLQLLDHLADDLVIGRSGPRDDRTRLGIAVELRPRQQFLEHLDGHLRIGLRDGIDHQLVRPAARLTRVHLVERLLDRLVLVGPSPHQQPPSLLIDRELGLREEILQERQDAVRVGVDNLVTLQLVLLLLGHVATELLDDVGNHQMFGRPGPDGEFPRLGVGDHAQSRHLGLEGRHHGQEPLPLGRVDRVDRQLRLLRRGQGRLDLLQGRLDQLVIFVRGHDHQPFAVRLQSDLGLGCKLAQHGQQTRRGRLDQRIEPQLRFAETGLFDLGHGLLDRFMLFRQGRHHKALPGSVPRDLGLRDQLAQGGRQTGREGLLQRVNVQFDPDTTRLGKLLERRFDGLLLLL